MAIVFDENKCSFSKVNIAADSEWEVVVGCGRFVGFPKPVLVVGCYIPPGYMVPRSTACLDFIRETVTELKRRYDDPYVVVSGDFNQWDVGGALRDFNDLLESPVGPSRGDRSIDRTFSNLTEFVQECGTVPPLEPDLPGAGAASDHLTTLVRCSIPRVRKFKWLSYSYQYFNEESVERFKRWVVLQPWNEVSREATSHGKALAYQRLINQAMEDCFPLITMRRKFPDPPWLNARL